VLNYKLYSSHYACNSWLVLTKYNARRAPRKCLWLEVVSPQALKKKGRTGFLV
jgi:hypothetical protein